jgi:hypothetical protein
MFSGKLIILFDVVRQKLNLGLKNKLHEIDIIKRLSPVVNACDLQIFADNLKLKFLRFMIF